MLALLQAGEILEAQGDILGDTIRVAARVGAHHQVVAHRQERKSLAALRHMADPASHDLVGRHTGNVAAFEHNLAPFRIQHAGNRTQDGGLTGAVCP